MRPASPRPWTTRHDDWQIEIIRGDAPGRQRREQELLDAGVPVPFGSRAVVASLGNVPSFFLTIHDSDGNSVGGVVVGSRPAPMIPGHSIYRVEQFGSSIPLEATDAAVSAMVEWVRSQRRVLRLSMDVFSFDEGRRLEFGRILASRGFRQPAHVNGYTDTLVIDLMGTEEDIFRALHHSARRKVRQIAKLPLTVRCIDDTDLGERMNTLLQETMARTGGRFVQRDWVERIALSRQYPDVSRIVGLFRTDVEGPDSLLAFAWGCHSSDHVYYSDAASTRDTGGLRAPLAYAPMWDLIAWARRTGARWFDLGGITHGTHEDEDPLGGISDFKRYFSQTVIRVRDEWILDTHSRRASLAAAVHNLIRRH
jgi:hypothetical protein